MILQKNVVPVCRFEITDGKAMIKHSYGTAFFINHSGVFITAKHVIESVIFDVKQYGGYMGLCCKDNKTENLGNIAVPIKNYEFAAQSYDIAVGLIEYECETMLGLPKEDHKHNIEVWQDIVTYGYPATIVTRRADYFFIALRAHKGYIQRLISPEAEDAISNNGNQPNSFETNFLISHGLSGAPLIIPNSNREQGNVIGVCVGCHKTEYNETIEEYGIAHDIRPLISWKPVFLNGKSLQEL